MRKNNVIIHPCLFFLQSRVCLIVFYHDSDLLFLLARNMQQFITFLDLPGVRRDGVMEGAGKERFPFDLSCSVLHSA